MTEPAIFKIVRNAEEQHALWQAHLPVPAGWQEIGISGTREECLAQMRHAWPDITPRSARLPTAG
jgi:MbtH protein